MTTTLKPAALNIAALNTAAPKTATLKTVTLGCKVNQYETEYVREGLLGIGYRDAGDRETADLCIVNTCTVTNEGDSKSRQAIRRLARENPDARIVVMGCYATRAADEIRALPGVAEVVTDKRELPDLLGRFGVLDIPTGISGFANRHRAYVKVQDGCLLRCSYCIIPYVRPKMYSRPPIDILEEVRRLVDNDFHEIILTGVHLGHYGVDFNFGKPKADWMRLSHLLKAIMRLPGEFRVRLSSIEATEVTRELVAVLAEFADRICPHLHICLQSGSDQILRRMRRRWGTRSFIDCCRRVSQQLDRPAFTTDVIVGFPGETDEDFDQTCKTVRDVGFSKVHVFPFSARRGTPAAEMSDQVNAAVKTQRCQELTAIERELRMSYFQSLVGGRLRALVESPVASASAASSAEPSSANRWLGTACRYAPIELPASASDEGRIVEVVAMNVQNDRIVCEKT
jgi:threonylcarbamoyladenosine tRNA methylthiotransferase MtaB